MPSSKEKKNAFSEINKLEREQIRLEKHQLKEQHIMKGLEKKQLVELAKLEKLEKEIKSQVKPHPLRDITHKDFIKASVGSIIGMVAHFAVIEGAHFAEKITLLRASTLYFLSFALGGILLYLTGFRKVEQVGILKILPLRLLVIYSTAVLWIIFVLFAFGLVDLTTSFTELYKKVAVISIVAVIGATIADMVGRE